MRISLFRITATVLIISVTLIIFISAFLYYIQDKMIFFPEKISLQAAGNIVRTHKNISEISLKMKDGTILQGWYVNRERAGPRRIIFYFGGNAEEVSYMIDEVGRFGGWSVVLINYRGYGLSEGTPGEKNLFSDSIEIYDRFISSAAPTVSKTVIMGRSVGTGVATYLAQNRKSDAVILVSPFDSLTSVAQELYPILPVRLILKHNFSSIERVPSIDTPLFMIIASADRTIPPWHSKKLASKWKGKCVIKEIQGTDHNSLSDSKDYWDSIAGFLKTLQ